MQDIAKIRLEREYSDNSSRPDFHFKHNNADYIIEFKIEDRNNHFEQYKKIFPKAKFGWIANYVMDKQEGIEIRTWEKFIEFLEERIIDSTTKDLIQYYIIYVRNICEIIKIQNMKLDNSPLYLMKVIRKIIEEQREEFVTSIYRDMKAGYDHVSCNDNCTQLRLGEYFCIEKKENKKSIYPWFGMYLQESGPEIWLEFSEEWCMPVYNELASKIRSNENNGGEYFSHYEDYGWGKSIIGFSLKEEWLTKINDAKTIEEQEHILKNFFNEVIQYVLQYI